MVKKIEYKEPYAATFIISLYNLFIAFAGGSPKVAGNIPSYERVRLRLTASSSTLAFYLFVVFTTGLFNYLYTPWVMGLSLLLSIMIFYYLLVSAYGIDKYSRLYLDSTNKNIQYRFIDHMSRYLVRISVGIVLVASAVGFIMSISNDKITTAYRSERYAKHTGDFKVNLASALKALARSEDRLSKDTSLHNTKRIGLYDNLHTLDFLQNEEDSLRRVAAIYAAKIRNGADSLHMDELGDYPLLFNTIPTDGFVQQNGKEYNYKGIRFTRSANNDDISILENYNDSLNITYRQLLINKKAQLTLRSQRPSDKYLLYTPYPRRTADSAYLSKVLPLTNPLIKGWLSRLLAVDNAKLSIRQKMNYFIGLVQKDQATRIYLIFLSAASLLILITLDINLRRVVHSEYPELLELSLQSEREYTKQVKKNISDSIVVLNKLGDGNEKRSLETVLTTEELTQLKKAGTAGHYMVLGRFYEEKNEFQLALDTYTEGYDRFPEEIEFLYRKSEVYGKMGESTQKASFLLQYNREQNTIALENNLRNAFRLESISTTQHPFYGDLVWKLNPKMNILLGRNGYGKSHLLSIMLGLLQNDFQKTEEFTPRTRNVGIAVEVTPSVSLPAGNHTITYDSEGLRNAFFNIPVLAIPDTRFIDKSNTEIGRTKEEIDLVQNAAYHFLYQKPYADVIGNVLFRICQTHFERRRQPLAIFKVFENIFQRLTGSSFTVQNIRSTPNSTYELFVATEGSERIEIQKVSQGTFSILTMIGIIYNYLTFRYPDVPEDQIMQQDAIVFIDEIDAHIHPEWQQKLINIFRELFPNIQFIITAHSPLIVAGCKTEEVAVLRKESNGFGLQYFEHDFIGYSPEELYRIVFQVEAFDETYLKYGAMIPYKQEITDEIATLEKRESRTAAESQRLEKLYDDLYYINVVIEKKAGRRINEDLISQNESLKQEIERLKTYNHATNPN